MHETFTNIVGAASFEDFRYLGSVMKVEGGSRKSVKQSVKVAWMKPREISGISCDKRIPRCKIYRKNMTSAAVRS